MTQTNLEIEKYYHIFNRGNNKELIFLKNENYHYFLGLVAKYLSPVCEILSYCLIPNHFHFVVKIKDEESLPNDFDKTKLHQPFSNLFNAYTKAFNKMFDRRGSLFQKNMKRVEIKNSEYLRNLIIYVNTNSNHHELSDCKLYKYNSYQALISKSATKIDRNAVLELFDDVNNLKFMFEKKKDKLDSIKEITFE